MKKLIATTVLNLTIALFLVAQDGCAAEKMHDLPIKAPGIIDNSTKCDTIAKCDELIANCSDQKDDFDCHTSCEGGACCVGTCIKGNTAPRPLKAPLQDNRQ